ncbi:WecB/TagA/CpsF family glycosyltransferase [Enterococcus faecalis]|uniref:WecB/TagA/CpsF family glycosyltransferase n=1 Tax=Enterococcus faecalis TaxID=1351 RepID=UPI0025B141A6|nr:WecB/TagA/CpsF family glycosyltransferase [Enterococcus faecalis]MDN3185220.1 WecB/TagA/CpsF family glycosyltransferase [Enterococcus faecalis]
MSLNETVQEILNRIKNDEIIEHIGVNSNKIVLLNNDIQLKKIIQSADIINADGISVVKAVRFLKGIKIERVTGIDTMNELIKHAEKENISVYFLGSKPEVLEKMVAKIHQGYPKLNILGYHHGYFNNEREVVDRIKNVRPDMLFVGITSPYKEYFIHKYKYELNAKLLMGVGGSFDVLSGNLKRAPKWMQLAGLEWFFRFIQEPKRLFKRYCIENIIFLKIIFRERLESSRNKSR